MAEPITVARPYAQAIFRLAQEVHEVDAWSDHLANLSLIAQNPEMGQVYNNPNLSPSQVADLFISLCNEKNNHQLEHLIILLAGNRRLPLLPYICELYEKLKIAAQGTKEVEVYSAFPLDEKQLAELMPQLEAHFSSKLKPRLEVDPELIGGIKAVVESRVFDASVRGKLDALSDALKEN